MPRQSFRPAVVAASVVACLALSACESTSSSSSSPMSASRPTTTSMGVLNDTCPVSGQAVNPGSKTASYGGYGIGFCCDNCLPQWDAMSAEAKQNYIADHAH